MIPAGGDAQLSVNEIKLFKLFDNFRSVLDIEINPRVESLKLSWIIFELYFMQRLENNYAKNRRN